MKINYDHSVDAKYVTLKEGLRVVETKSVNDWLLVDFDANGVPVGVEILEATKNHVQIVLDDNSLLLRAASSASDNTQEPMFKKRFDTLKQQFANLKSVA